MNSATAFGSSTMLGRHLSPPAVLADHQSAFCLHGLTCAGCFLQAKSSSVRPLASGLLHVACLLAHLVLSACQEQKMRTSLVAKAKHRCHQGKGAGVQKERRPSEEQSRSSEEPLRGAAASRMSALMWANFKRCLRTMLLNARAEGLCRSGDIRR